MATSAQQKALHNQYDSDFADIYENDIDNLIQAVQTSIDQLTVSELANADIDSEAWARLSFVRDDIALLEYVKAKKELV